MKLAVYLKSGIVISVLSLVACQTPTPLVAPPNNPNPVTLPSLPASVINVPISIDLETVRAEVLKNVPKPLSQGKVTQVLTIANTALPVESDITHTVHLRDVKLSLTGQDFVATTQLEFSVATKTRAGLLNMGGVSCGIGEELPKIEFTLPTKLYWTTTGDLAVQAGQWQLKWLKPCNITAFNFNVEKMVNLPIVRQKVQVIVSENINATLLLQPETVGLTDIVGTGRYLKTNFSLIARPKIVTGDKPRIVLPSIPQPQRLLSSGDGFYLALRGDVDLETANRLLNEKLANKPFDAGGKTVFINSLKLYGSGDKAVLGLRLQQPINAEIFLLGKLVLDTNKNELSLQDIEFELATSSLLAKSANWMLHGTFKNLIAEKARFSFDKDLANVLQDFKDYRQSLGYGATLKAQLANVRPQGVFFSTTDIKAFVVVEGKLALEVAH